MAITTFKRFEMKFILSKEQFEQLQPGLLQYMNPDEYCKNGNNYSLYNIYYDTFDNKIIRASLSKPFHKEKLRLRSYTTPTSMNSKVYLELKKKTAGIVHKRRASMTLQEAYEFIEWGKRPAAISYMSRQIINELDYFLSRNEVFPAAYISYKRMAFFGKSDKEFRITFDSSITTRRNDLYLEKGSFGEQLLENGQYLMEVKISRSVPLWLAELLSDLKIYKTSFSKYGTEFKNYCEKNRAKGLNFNFDSEVIPQTERLCPNY